MNFFFPINLVNGPSPLPPFSTAVAGRSSPLIGVLWADSIEWVQKRMFQKPYIKIINSFWIVLRETLFSKLFSMTEGYFFVSQNLFSYYNDLYKL